MQYIFKAKNQQGKIKEGVIEALSQQSAIEILQKNDLVPLVIEEIRKTSPVLKELNRLWEGASQKEVAIFFRQMSTLIEAKVPIIQALMAIEEQTSNKYLRLVIREIAADVQEGMPFSESLEKHPETFSKLATNIIRAGEISGNLQSSVSFMANSMEKSNQLNSRIKSALYYPAFVLLVASVVGFAVISFILPKLTDVIKQMELEVPWYTKVVMAFGDFMRIYWWLVLILIIGMIIAFIYYIRTESGRREWDVIKIKIPVIKNLLQALYIARFSDNLALMVNAGIPIVRSLFIVSEIVGNSVYQAVILRAADEVRSGGRMSAVFARSDHFPPVVAQMTRIGEETGKLGEVLKSVTKFYDQEIEKITRNMTALIEPILIVVLAIGVAIMVFSILLPIYNIAGKM